MKSKVIGAAILLYACNSQGAEVIWTQIGESENAKISIDSGSIKRTDNRVRVWVKSNYTHPVINMNFSNPAKSSLNQVEVDCAADRWALTYISYYSGIDGDGIVVWSKTLRTAEFNFVAAPPGTVGSIYLSLACNN